MIVEERFVNWEKSSVAGRNLGRSFLVVTGLGLSCGASERVASSVGPHGVLAYA